jgi:hypothetical protein
MKMEAPLVCELVELYSHETDTEKELRKPKNQVERG